MKRACAVGWSGFSPCVTRGWNAAVVLQGLYANIRGGKPRVTGSGFFSKSRYAVISRFCQRPRAQPDTEQRACAVLFTPLGFTHMDLDIWRFSEFSLSVFVLAAPLHNLALLKSWIQISKILASFFHVFLTFSVLKFETQFWMEFYSNRV